MKYDHKIITNFLAENQRKLTFNDIIGVLGEETLEKIKFCITWSESLKK